MVNAREAAALLGVSKPTMLKYLSEGRVVGAQKNPETREWEIPTPVLVVKHSQGLGYRQAARVLGLTRGQAEVLFQNGGILLPLEDNRVGEAELKRFKRRVKTLAKEMR